MPRLFSFALMIIICLYGIRCTRYLNTPLPEAQRLIMAKPWILVYTDSIYGDSLNHVHHHLVPARECEKQEPVTFAENFNYYINLVCDQPDSAVLNGQWTYTPDSVLGYALKSDTGVYASMNTARLEIVTSDSLKLIQQSSFATPDIRDSFFFEKTYSH